MPPFSKTTLLVCSRSGLSPGTYTDAAGGKVLISQNPNVYVTAQETGRLTEYAAECQVLAGSGGSVTVTLRDSWDGVTWNPWIAFTPITGVLTNPGQSMGITRNPGALV